MSTVYSHGSSASSNHSHASAVLVSVVDDPPTSATNGILNQALDKMASVSILKGSIITVAITILIFILGFYMIPNEILTIIDYTYQNVTALTEDELANRDSLYLALVILVGIFGFVAIVISIALAVNVYRRKSATEAKLEAAGGKWTSGWSKCAITSVSMNMVGTLIFVVVLNIIVIGSKHKSNKVVAQAEQVIGIINLILYVLLCANCGVLIWITSITNKKDLGTVAERVEGHGSSAGSSYGSGYGSAYGRGDQHSHNTYSTTSHF